MRIGTVALSCAFAAALGLLAGSTYSARNCARDFTKPAPDLLASDVEIGAMRQAVQSS